MKGAIMKIVMMALIFASGIQLFAQEKNMDWINKVGARKSQHKKTIFIVNDYGAVNDGKTLASASIQKAIDACGKNGGGIVTFKPGQYLYGVYFFKK